VDSYIQRKNDTIGHNFRDREDNRNNEILVSLSLFSGHPILRSTRLFTRKTLVY